jgi:YHS domain-containing protein
MIKKTMVMVFAAIILVAAFNALVLAQDKPVQTAPTTTPEKVVKPAIKPAKDAAGEKAAQVKTEVKTAPAVMKTMPIKEKADETGKSEPPKGMPIHPGLRKPAANMLAVCSCGMLIKPTAATKHFTYADKEYDVCSDYCLENAQKDPAAAVKTIETHMAAVMNPSPMK